MPGWHARTRELQKEGKLQLVGIIQEQHPDRCRLFMQWKEMGWPILVDSLNRLGLRGVPIAMFLDENGVVRKSRVDRDEIDRLVAAEYPPPERQPEPSPEEPSPRARRADAQKRPTDAAAWLGLGDALFLSGRREDLDESVAAYRKAGALAGPPQASFRLGVALRRRYETAARQSGDFQQAVDAWAAALERRPNQYIWRRRIQQYGPRLDKPYSFYDWVAKAREAIRARGEEPVELAVEPGGAEIAYPSKVFPGTREEPAEPDPEGKIDRDAAILVEADITVAPATEDDKRSARVHLTLRPSSRKNAHWNNEAGPLAVWVNPPAGVEVSQRHHVVAGPKSAVSHEPRKVELEVRVDETRRGRDGDRSIRIPAYALYYVCEDVDGVCLYRRQDLEIEVEL